MRVHPVDLPAELGALLLGAEHGDQQEGGGGAEALDRVTVDATALDPALRHASTDREPGELHDHVGAAGRQREADHAVADLGGTSGGPPGTVRTYR